MTLPSSGPLSFNDINLELGNVTESEADFRVMSSAAGFIQPDSIDEFYNFTASSTIVYDYSGSITVVGLNTADDKDLSQTLDFTGIGDTDVITLNVNITAEAAANVSSRVLYSINNTTVGTTLLLLTTLAADNDVTIPGVQQGDVVRIRINTNATAGSRTTTVTLTGGTFTTGSGTVTASDTTSWAVEVTSGA